jgi:hypothetical protein
MTGIYRQQTAGISRKNSRARDDRGHPIPLGRGWEGSPSELAEVEFLNGKGLRGLGQWFRKGYLPKLIKEMGDHPYNTCSQTELKRSDPRERIISGSQEAFQ